MDISLLKLHKEGEKYLRMQIPNKILTDEQKAMLKSGDSVPFGYLLHLNGILALKIGWEKFNPANPTELADRRKELRANLPNVAEVMLGEMTDILETKKVVIVSGSKQCNSAPTHVTERLQTLLKIFSDENATIAADIGAMDYGIKGDAASFVQFIFKSIRDDIQKILTEAGS